MTKSHLREIMARVNAFPGMPGAAIRLLGLLENPNLSAAQVEDAVRYDPGMTANILRLANSAYFGFASRIGSVRQALVLLGSSRVKQLVVASCLNAVMDTKVYGYELPPGQLWHHSIAVSVAAEALVAELGIADAPEVFTAALLHDVGKLVLGGFVKEDLATIEAEADKGIAFQQAERLVLGTDHAEVGALILEHWNLPAQMIHAVRWHHEPDAAAHPTPLQDIVHVANVLCLMMGIGVGREGLRYEPSPGATGRLKLKTRHLEAVSSRTLQWMSELSAILGSASGSKSDRPGVRSG